MESNQNWLKTSAGKQSEKTLATFVTSDEFAALKEHVGPQFASAQFQADFKFFGCAWIYVASTGRRCLVVSAKEKSSPKDIRGLAAKAVKQLQTLKITDVEFLLSASIFDGKYSELVAYFESAFIEKNYQLTHKRDIEAKEGADQRTLRNLTNVVSYEILRPEGVSLDGCEVHKFQVACTKAQLIAEDMWATRGSVATPDFMEKRAREIAEGKPLVKKFEVVKGQQLVEQGMNLLYGVGRGAVEEARCICVHYVGDDSRPDEVDLAIIGKGITFDTGGLNIKLSLIEKMHRDKGGSCSTLGALSACLELKIKKNIVFTLAIAENAIGPNAQKPGDIVTGMNGLSVEIANTDAEGRLAMADASTYTQRNYNPKKVIYIATLTGACARGLGTSTAGFFAPTDEFAKIIKQASKDAFEAFWHLPLDEKLRKETVGREGADLSNLGKPAAFGGSSHAAAFLEAFVEKDRLFAHLDIVQGAINPELLGLGTKTLVNIVKGV